MKYIISYILWTNSFKIPYPKFLLPISFISKQFLHLIFHSITYTSLSPSWTFQCITLDWQLFPITKNEFIIFFFVQYSFEIKIQNLVANNPRFVPSSSLHLPPSCNGWLFKVHNSPAAYRGFILYSSCTHRRGVRSTQILSTWRQNQFIFRAPIRSEIREATWSTIGGTLCLDLVLYNFLKNPCPRIELLSSPRRRLFPHPEPRFFARIRRKFNFLPLLSQHFDCRNHIRVIQPMGDGNRLYMCGTNAHSPKDWVIYVSICVFVLHFGRLFHQPHRPTHGFRVEGFFSVTNPNVCQW